MGRDVGGARDVGGPLTMPTLDEALAKARASIAPRVDAADLDDELAKGSLVVDIRSEPHRERDGELPGATVVDRNVLEWRLEPGGSHRLAEMDGGRRVVLVCDEGYASSLAAAALRDLGVSDATDVAGGYQAWRAHRASRLEHACG